VREPIQFEPCLDFALPGIAGVWHLAQALGNELCRPDGSRLMRAMLRDTFIVNLLMCVRHNYSDAVHAPKKSIAPGYVREAEEYIAAHLDEPITLSTIVKEVGISGRSLQTAFRAHRGCSPMQFLKERRLELARQRLSRAEPGATVTGIATTVGMDHLGRFSVEYKKRFGENPTETMQRRRRR